MPRRTAPAGFFIFQSIPHPVLPNRGARESVGERRASPPGASCGLARNFNLMRGRQARKENLFCGSTALCRSIPPPMSFRRSSLPCHSDKRHLHVHSDDRTSFVISTTKGRRNLHHPSRRQSLSHHTHHPDYPRISTLRARCHCVRNDSKTVVYVGERHASPFLNVQQTGRYSNRPTA